MIVRLTHAQLSMASHVASMRHIANLQKKIEPRYGAPNGTAGFEINIAGCCAEVAVARYLNLFWCGTVNDFGARDVGGLVDVRSTSRRDGRLIMHPADKDEVPYVFVVANPPMFNLAGWIFGAQAKRDEWWCDPTGQERPAFFVPDVALNDMESLLMWVQEQRGVKVGTAA